MTVADNQPPAITCPANRTVNAAHTEKLDEHRELERKLNEALQSNAQLQSDLQQAVAELSSRSQVEARSEADRAVHGEVAAMVQSEMIRVRALLDEIETKLADPSTELGSEIRLNRERGVLPNLQRTAREFHRRRVRPALS